MKYIITIDMNIPLFIENTSPARFSKDAISLQKDADNCGTKN